MSSIGSSVAMSSTSSSSSWASGMVSSKRTSPIVVSAVTAQAVPGRMPDGPAHHLPPHTHSEASFVPLAGRLPAHDSMLSHCVEFSSLLDYPGVSSSYQSTGNAPWLFSAADP